MLNETRVQKIPSIQAIVLNKQSGLPGIGYDDFLPERLKQRLKTKGRRHVLRVVLEEVFSFEHWDEVLFDVGLSPLVFEDDPLELERLKREKVYTLLLEAGGQYSASPTILHELRIYQGQSAIWRDAKRTSTIAGNEIGITVSFYHKGDIFPADLTETGLTFHYPNTNRRGSTDEHEIDATKIAASFSLPVFVVTDVPTNRSLREVRKGFITGWDDNLQIFSIAFSANRPKTIQVIPTIREATKPFSLDAPATKEGLFSSYYARDPHFRTLLISRYGAKCAVCRMEILDVLDGVHIKAKQFGGSDDPRNGLLLCATHHRAFDKNLFFIDPDDFAIKTNLKGPSLAELGISKMDIKELPNLPHTDALRWAWETGH